MNNNAFKRIYHKIKAYGPLLLIRSGQIVLPPPAEGLIYAKIKELYIVSGFLCVLWHPGRSFDGRNYVLRDYCIRFHYNFFRSTN